MAKSDTPFDQLELSRVYSPPHTASFAEGKSVNGFDTETIDGDIFMLSMAFDGFGGYVEESDGQILEKGQLWEYITHSRCAGALNMWYNLNFDADVLCKHLLSDRQLAILKVNNKVTQPIEALNNPDIEAKWTITYIPSKFLKIKDNNRHVYTHYDASQFFFASLEKAAKEWLDANKLTETTETALFGTNTPDQLKEAIERSDAVDWDDVPVTPGDKWTLIQAKDYIDDNYGTIKKYARKDAELVRDLWKEAIRVGEGVGIPMGRPFSTGYLGESYLNEHLYEKPGVGPYDMAKMAWESYAGGRFEILKRGNIGPVAGPDINSAYPYVISTLPDPKTLEWHHPENPSIEAIRQADYGFVRATVTTDQSRPIQPFAIKDESDDILKYPALESHTVTVVKDIFIHAYDNGYLESLDIQEAWLGHATDGTQYPFDFVSGLYARRQEAKANGKDSLETMLKVVLTSMYGKFCQTTPKRRKFTEKQQLEKHEYFVGTLSLPEFIRAEYENGFIEWLEAGSWFNPFLAAYTTGKTRLQLHKAVLDHNLEHDVVMLATDCLMIEQPAFDESGFINAKVSDGLGNWDYDYSGEAFVIAPGIYQVDMDDKTKVQTRGFKEADLTQGLRHEASKANGHIEIESNRPTSLGEAIWLGQEVSDIGNFTRYSRKLNADMDSKRSWDTSPDFAGLLAGTGHSEPLTFSG